MSGLGAAAVGGSGKKEKKEKYLTKLVGLLEEYSKILIVSCDNIGSKHMQRIRLSIRGRAVLLMGKNTMIRKAIRGNLENNPAWESLLTYITGNVGLIFTNDDNLAQLRDVVLNNKVPASAKPGIKAPQDVVIAKGITPLEPTKTSFLQALNIASKINKGTIEILQDIHLIKKGDKVGSSESTLLQMLDIRPFQYGLELVAVYDSGSTMTPEVLDMTDSEILSKFAVGIANVASFSLGLGFPTIAAFPHVVLNAYKNLLAIVLETDFSFERAAAVKERALNPEAYAAHTTTTTTSHQPSSGGSSAPAAAAEEPAEEEEEAGLDFDLFG